MNDTKKGMKLLGSLPFVSRTFEGHFKDSPYVLDMDANLYIGPAVNQIKLLFYRLCQRLDREFQTRELTEAHKRAEQRVLRSVYADAELPE